MKRSAVLASLAIALSIPAVAEANFLTTPRARHAIKHFGAGVCSDASDICDHVGASNCRRATSSIVLCTLTYYGTDSMDCWTTAKARLSPSNWVRVTTGHVTCDDGSDY